MFSSRSFLWRKPVVAQALVIKPCDREGDTVENGEFKVTSDGVQHSCTYAISGGSIKSLTVITPFGTEVTGLGGLPPEVLARRLAEKMARQAAAATPRRLGRENPFSEAD